LTVEEEWDYLRSPKGRRLGLQDWSFARLEQALHEVASFSSDTTKICLFIDGLDEYEGGPEALVEFLQVISKFPHVKICVSSRPWIIFEESFESCPGLRLQDLTYSDIHLYVREKLELNTKMRRLKEVNLAGAMSLARNIVTKANGVFLWVKLVIRSLLDGLRNRDSILDLHRRLGEIPSDLDALYDRMIGRINPPAGLLDFSNIRLCH